MDYHERYQAPAQGPAHAAPKGFSDTLRLANALESIRDDQQSADAGEREARDLSANEAQARWARWSAWAAVVQFFVSGIGLAALIYTLRQTDISLKEARRANRITLLEARRSRRSDEDARASERRQLRAYVFLEAAGLIEGAAPNLPRFGFAICTIAVKNSGQTPAYGVHHWGELRLLPLGRQNELIVPEINLKPMNAVAQGGLVHKTVSSDHALTSDEIERIRRSELAVFIFGRIVYRDAFEEPRCTDYRLSWTGSWPPLPGTMMVFAEEGNSSD